MNIFKKIIAILTICTLIPLFAFADPDSQVDSLRDKKEKSEETLTELQEDLSEAMSKLDKAEVEIGEKQDAISRAQEVLKDFQDSEKKQLEEMRARIIFLYENNSKSAKIERIINAKSLSSLISDVDHMESLYKYDRKKLKEYVDTKDAIKAYTEDLAIQSDEMEELQEKYEAEAKELRTLINDKQAEIEDLDRQLQIAAAQAETAKRWKAMREMYPDHVDGDNPNGEKIVKAAYSQLGVPYVWGGTTPNKALDCSGLTQYCYRCAGVKIPRTSSAQLAAGQLVVNPSPGDICWTPGHVAIYVGDGKMIEAQQTGVPVKVSTVRVTYYIRFT